MKTTPRKLSAIEPEPMKKSLKAAPKRGWIHPSVILFATEIPASEKAFELALAEAGEFGASLILFHAYDMLVVGEPGKNGFPYHDYEADLRVCERQLEPLAERARRAGVKCEVVVRAGLPVEQILAFAREREVDRIVIETHSPGPAGKLLVGPVAEAVLRRAEAPVYLLSPEAALSGPRDGSPRTILCAADMRESSGVVTEFAAGLAAEIGARLVLQHVIQPQERAQALAGRTLDDVEAELLELAPAGLREQVEIETIVVSGDPTEELLHQSRVQQACLIVLGAQSASAFAAIARHGVIYKTLAHAHCPVVTLSPVVLAASAGAGKKPPQRVETCQETYYMAGVF